MTIVTLSSDDDVDGRLKDVLREKDLNTTRDSGGHGCRSPRMNVASVLKCDTIYCCVRGLERVGDNDVDEDISLRICSEITNVSQELANILLHCHQRGSGVRSGTMEFQGGSLLSGEQTWWLTAKADMRCVGDRGRSGVVVISYLDCIGRRRMTSRRCWRWAQEHGQQ